VSFSRVRFTTGEAREYIFKIISHKSRFRFRRHGSEACSDRWACLQIYITFVTIS